MLDPGRPYLESKLTEIYFDGDDPHALILLLNIAHMQFKKLLSKLEHLQQLYYIAVLCDKYDLVAWTSEWMAKWRLVAQQQTVQDYEEFVFVSWFLGDKAIFKQAIHQLIFESETDKAEFLSNRCGSAIGETFPQNVEGECNVAWSYLGNFLSIG